MNKEFLDLTDAFLALRDIDDDEVSGMLKNKNLHEGKEFSIQHGSQDIEAARKFLEETSNNVELEVIDTDADSVDHLKNNKEYIGQGILRCNRCMANKFVDMDTLVASENDPDLYNIDDECPHCHDAGAGYTLVGQVGKVQKAAEQPEQVAADETVDQTADVEVENDAKSDDEATFDNDLESDEASEETPEKAAEAEEKEEDISIDTLEDEEESDGMETETSEDEFDDLDLPDLGDVVDEDDVKEDDDKEDVSVKESYLNEAFVNHLAEDAWMMNRVISSMNNEEAYYGSWLYIWPDGETKEMCSYDFGDQESYDELRDTFLRTYKFYHADGLYEADEDVLDYAHSIDRELHLAPIENLKKPTSVSESYESDSCCEVVGDLLKKIVSPDHIEKIIVVDVSNEDAVRDIFTGTHEDLPINVIGSTCKSFDVQDGYLTCNIDSEAEARGHELRTVLDMFEDDETEKVLLWDQALGDEVFSGTKADAIKQFGNCRFISFETPAVIKFNVINPSLLTQDEIEGESVEPTDLEKLVNKVIAANNLSIHKVNNPITNEYWIHDAIMNNEDVELIYETFVKPLENRALTDEFKSLTGYTNTLDEAYESGFNAATENAEVSEGFTRAEFDEFQKLCKELNFKTMLDVAKFAEKEGGVTDQALLDALRKAAANRTTDESVDDQKDNQEECECEDCCEDKRKSFKTRKELSAAIEECKNNNQAYTVRRSLTDGYRYDLVLHEGDSEETDMTATPAVPVKRPFTALQKSVMNEIYRISRDICVAVTNNYGIETDPALVVADILQDLKLISGELSPEDLPDDIVGNATRTMYRSYENFYRFVDSLISEVTGTEFRTTPAQKLEQAKRMLFSPAFSTEAIEAGIRSTKFLQAARNGDIPYLADNIQALLPEELEEDTDCEDCDSNTEEESADIDIEKFDRELNAYIHESYDEDNFALYTTLSGEFNDKGQIILEGVIERDGNLMDVNFTLTPTSSNTIYESAKDFADNLTYRVTNNISEEVFEFTFKDNLSE